MTDRRNVLENLKTWTAEGLTVNGEDDRQNFQKFYDSNPEFKEAWLERIRKGGADQEYVFTGSVASGRSSRPT